RSFLPSPKWWSDNFAFINNTYSNQQITIGIATLDALDNSGKLYETATSEGFEADHLTSQPINLNYTSAENIWFSFYYQPGGLGDKPELKDSLTLQFFAPEESRWRSVWKADTSRQLKFKPVIIRIEDSRYLKTGFKFRFVNWASLSSDIKDPSMIGNCDHWNIDYVYLNKNRNAADTSLADVAFSRPLRSILKTHEAMPWKQFRQVYLQEMGSSIPIHYRNNDKITRNVTRNFEIRDLLTNTVSHSFSAGAANVDPFTNVDYNANLIYTFNNSSTDSAIFRITCYLKTDDFDPKGNDTLVYNQVFRNYFAYDDGSSEGGYGINGQGSRNAMVAYRFKSFLQDTIRAIRICFNDSYLNSNQRAFDIMIWDDNNGLPGNVIYSAENMLVEPGDEINGYHTYILPDGVMVNGVFYAGWRQRSETFLNAGFDVNTPNRGRQYYWLNGTWLLSQKDGSIMIRPVVGAPIKTTSSDDVNPPDIKRYTIWPNPASDYINLNFTELALSRSAYVSIIDMQGRELMKVPYSERIDISRIRPGIYTVIAISEGRRTGFFRLVITK
ncbi:MAG TPA: T9SS type A sorting domain-containing protein, partial [Bacteroidales bacterium]|nr:T9SS type A sorting domain-containing protein [Bacteroidales bacterium]